MKHTNDVNVVGFNTTESLKGVVKKALMHLSM